MSEITCSEEPRWVLCSSGRPVLLAFHPVHRQPPPAPGISRMITTERAQTLSKQADLQADLDFITLVDLPARRITRLLL